MALQKQEIFIPLSTGTDTGSDPRLPRAGTLTAKNANFTVRGTVQKRDPLVAYHGTPSTDTASSLGSPTYYVATHQDEESVIFFGEDVREIVGLGGSVSSYGTPNGITIAGLGRIVDVETEYYFSEVTNNLAFNVDFAVARSAATSESDIVFVSRELKNGNGNIIVIGEESKKVKYNNSNAGNYARGGVAVHTGVNGEAYAVSTVSSYFHRYKWDQVNQAMTVTNSGNQTYVDYTKGPAHGVYVGTVNGTKRVLYGGESTNTSANITKFTVANLDIETPAVTATADYSTSSGFNTATQSYSSMIPWDTANAQSLFMFADCNATKIEIHFYILQAAAASITTIASGNTTLTAAGYDTAITKPDNIIHLGAMKDSSASFMFTASWYDDAVGAPTTVGQMCDVNTSNAVIEVNTDPARICLGPAHPVSAGFQDDSNNYYQIWGYFGGRWWNDTISYDNLSPQNFRSVMRRTGDPDFYAYHTYVPVGRFHQYIPTGGTGAIQKFLAPVRTYVDYKGNTVQAIASITQRNEEVSDTSWSAYDISLNKISFARQDLRAFEHRGYTIIPNSDPLVYDGRHMVHLGPLEYPDWIDCTINAGGGSFQNAGGVGDYTYCCTFTYYDANGLEVESAPSYSVTQAITANTNSILIDVPLPIYSYLRPRNAQSPEPSIRIYRTDVNGNLFHMIHQFPVSITGAAYSTYVYRFEDVGTTQFGVNTGGFSSGFLSKSLYTDAGELEAVAPRPHRTGCIHQDRWFYADREHESTDIYYSKSAKPGIGQEFNDVLKITCSSIGGRITALRSMSEKLFIFKENSIYVTYGSALNDTGSGSGYEPPRQITQNAGVIYGTAASSGQDGIFFINGVDGDIYLLGPDEQISFIGDAVLYYTKKYTYRNVCISPKNNYVLFTSQDSGAPTLVYNYRQKLWSTFDGRYEGPIYDAITAKATARWSGYGTEPLDIILDNSNNAFIQSPTGNWSTEDFELDLTTSWIPLGSIAGYGRLYDQEVVLGAPVAGTNIEVNTAYDNDPQWIDQTNIAINTNAFDYTNHYTMTGTTFEDQSAKFHLDGSRHKCDSVRYRIRETDGTVRNNLEIIGLKLSVGTKSGPTKLGSARSYNSSDN